MNTLEQFVLFLPLLWLATIIFHTGGHGCRRSLGLIWIVGRILYMEGYMARSGEAWAGISASERRATGAPDPGDRRHRAGLVGGARGLIKRGAWRSVDLNQFGKQRRQVLEPDHVRPVGRRVVRILMRLHEDGGDTHRHGRARDIGRHLAIAAG